MIYKWIWDASTYDCSEDWSCDSKEAKSSHRGRMWNTTEFNEILCGPVLDSCDDVEKDADTETYIDEKMMTENRLKRRG